MMCVDAVHVATVHKTAELGLCCIGVVRVLPSRRASRGRGRPSPAALQRQRSTCLRSGRAVSRILCPGIGGVRQRSAAKGAQHGICSAGVRQELRAAVWGHTTATGLAGNHADREGRQYCQQYHRTEPARGTQLSAAIQQKWQRRDLWLYSNVQTQETGFAPGASAATSCGLLKAKFAVSSVGNCGSSHPYSEPAAR